jgi:NTE family protein
MPSVGVVLGAGGIVGAAYHAGVLTALAEAGFDARDAELIVGTSAGSAVGATLRAGFPPLDLAARDLGESVSAEAASIVGFTGGPPTLDLRPRPFSRPPLPSSPRLLLRSARHPTKALAGLLPTGTIAADVIGERIALLYGDRSWPEQPLWICAVDLKHGDRVVFGRDAPDAAVGVAVQASSSIPGFFRPVEHDGRRYVDGGVHSPTNADLVARSNLDIVVIVSPMSATRLAHGALLPNARPMHARRLANEVERIRRSGAEVLTFQPTPDVVTAMGRNSMDPARRAGTTDAALSSARERLGDPRVAERLELLRAASLA